MEVEKSAHLFLLDMKRFSLLIIKKPEAHCLIRLLFVIDHKTTFSPQRILVHWSLSMFLFCLISHIFLFYTFASNDTNWNCSQALLDEFLAFCSVLLSYNCLLGIVMFSCSFSFLVISLAHLMNLLFHGRQVYTCCATVRMLYASVILLVALADSRGRLYIILSTPCLGDSKKAESIRDQSSLMLVRGLEDISSVPKLFDGPSLSPLIILMTPRFCNFNFSSPPPS